MCLEGHCNRRGRGPIGYETTEAPDRNSLLVGVVSRCGASWMVGSSSRLEDSIGVLAGGEGLVSSRVAAVGNPAFLIGASILIRMLPTQQARTKMDADWIMSVRN